MTRPPARMLALLVLLLPPLVLSGPAPAPASSAATSGAPPPVRILIVGDSVTQGSAGDWTWRYRLWQHFASQGVAVDFVGPRDDLWDRNRSVAGNHEYADPAFDQDHAALWGMLLLHQPVPIETLMTDYTPDVVVELLGFNDIRYGATVADVDAGLTDFVDGARSVDPAVDVVLGDLGETWVDGVQAFDDQLAGFAAGLDTADSRVVATADPGLTEFVDTYDPAHPAATGEVKIAIVVADALAEVGVGSTMAPPSLPVPNGPRLAPSLRVVAGDGQATLSWRLPPGADKVYVETREVSTGAGWQRLPIPIEYPQLGWTSGGLTNGHTYAYRLRAAKGTAIAEDLASPAVSVTPGVPARVHGLAVRPRRHGFRATWERAALARSYLVRWWPVGHPGRADSLTTRDLAVGRRGLVAGREYVVSVAGRRSGLVGPRATARVTPTS